MKRFIVTTTSGDSLDVHASSEDEAKNYAMIFLLQTGVFDFPSSAKEAAKQ